MGGKRVAFSFFVLGVREGVVLSPLTCLLSPLFSMPRSECTANSLSLSLSRTLLLNLGLMKSFFLAANEETSRDWSASWSRSSNILSSLSLSFFLVGLSSDCWSSLSLSLSLSLCVSKKDKPGGVDLKERKKLYYRKRESGERKRKKKREKERFYHLIIWSDQRVKTILSSSLSLCVLGCECACLVSSWKWTIQSVSIRPLPPKQIQSLGLWGARERDSPFNTQLHLSIIWGRTAKYPVPPSIPTFKQRPIHSNVMNSWILSLSPLWSPSNPLSPNKHYSALCTACFVVKGDFKRVTIIVFCWGTLDETQQWFSLARFEQQEITRNKKEEKHIPIGAPFSPYFKGFFCPQLGERKKKKKLRG